MWRGKGEGCDLWCVSCADEKEIARGRDDWQTTQRVIWVIVSEKERENY